MHLDPISAGLLRLFLLGPAVALAAIGIAAHLAMRRTVRRLERCLGANAPSELAAGEQVVVGRWVRADEGWALVVDNEPDPIPIRGPVALRTSDEGRRGAALGTVQVMRSLDAGSRVNARPRFALTVARPYDSLARPDDFDERRRVASDVRNDGVVVLAIAILLILGGALAQRALPLLKLPI